MQTVWEVGTAQLFKGQIPTRESLSDEDNDRQYNQMLLKATGKEKKEKGQGNNRTSNYALFRVIYVFSTLDQMGWSETIFHILKPIILLL